MTKPGSGFYKKPVVNVKPGPLKNRISGFQKPGPIPNNSQNPRRRRYMGPLPSQQQGLLSDLAGVRERVDEGLHEDVAAPVGQREAALHALLEQQALHEHLAAAEHRPEMVVGSLSSVYGRAWEVPFGK